MARAFRVAGQCNGPPDSGVRGRLQRDPVRRTDPAPGETRSAKFSLRLGAVLAGKTVSFSIWHIRRQPV